MDSIDIPHKTVIKVPDNNQSLKTSTPIQEVLDEDSYTEAISDIIKRDYFPSLKTLEAQNVYLDALDAKDPVLLRNATLKLTELSTPSRKTPAATPLITTPHQEWDTPITTRTTNVFNINTSPEKKYNTDLSLDVFQAKYTSEDNASFSELMKKSEDQRREKYKWMYEREKGPPLLEDGKGTPFLIESGSLENRPSQIGSWKYKVKNSLMFYPEGHQAQTEENTRVAPKQILSANTRFESADETNINDHAAAIAAGLDTSAPSELLSELGSPRVDGYGFVSPTPSLNPSQVDSSELMTWGVIEGTPLLINGDQTPGPSFSLPPTPRREMLGMNLSSNASRNIRKRMNALNSPRTLSRSAFGANLASPNARAAMLSPAARKLLRKSHKSHMSPNSHLDPQLRSSYGTSLHKTSLRNVPFSPVRLSSPSNVYVRKSSAASLHTESEEPESK